MQTITTIGLDIAKSIFQVHGIDAGARQGVFFPPFSGISVGSNRLLRPVELDPVDPHAMQNDCELACDRNLGLAEPVALGEPYGYAPGFGSVPIRRADATRWRDHRENPSNRRPIELIGSPTLQRSQISDRWRASNKCDVAVSCPHSIVAKRLECCVDQLSPPQIPCSSPVFAYQE